MLTKILVFYIYHYELFTAENPSLKKYQINDFSHKKLIKIRKRKSSEDVGFTKLNHKPFYLFHCCPYIFIRIYKVLNISGTQIP